MLKHTIVGTLVGVIALTAIVSAIPSSAKAADWESGYKSMVSKYNKETTRITPFIRVVSPSGSKYAIGENAAPLNVTWQGINLAANTLDISIVNTVTNASFVLATSTPNTGSTTVKVPLDVPAGKYSLKIKTSSPSLVVEGVSAKPFEISVANITRVLKVVNQPKASLTLGDTASTSWTTTGLVPKVDIFLVSGTSSTRLVQKVNNTGSYSYVIPAKTASSSYFFKIVDSASSTVSATTSVFAVSADPAIVISPETLPHVVVNTAYSTTTSATGGSGAGYVFTATGLPAGLSINRTNGLISGKITSATRATTSVEIKVTDSRGNSATKTYTLSLDLVAFDPIVISPASSTLPVAVKNMAYSTKLSATGGSGAGYVFTATGLPAGLSLNRVNGTISGTTAVVGSSTVVVTVVDNKNNSKVSTYTLPVAEAPAIVLSPASTTLPLAIKNVAYTTTLSATGGSGAGYVFTATGLPTGLTLGRTSGVISGKTLAVGSSTVAVTVKDSKANTVSVTYTLPVAEAPALSLSPATLPDVTVGVVYNTTLSATGGSGSGYVFSAVGLPSGLSLSKSGVISGKITSAGNSPRSVTVTVTDGAKNSTTKGYSLNLKLR